MAKTREQLDREDYEHFQSTQDALDGAPPDVRAQKLSEELALMKKSRERLEQQDN